MSWNVFIGAGEVSGDIAGGLLARAIRARDPSARVSGIGGSHMASAGVEIAFASDDRAPGRPVSPDLLVTAREEAFG